MATLVAFGTVIRRARHKRGLSIEQLSERTGIPAHRLRYIETRVALKLPDVDVLNTLAAALDTTPSALVAGMTGTPEVNHD